MTVLKSLKAEREKRLAENPGLYLLYMKWAVTHLLVIDSCIKQLSSHSNMNLLDSVIALQEQREKLIKENPEYQDADDIVKAMRNKKDGYRIPAPETAEEAAPDGNA
jgi:hypothetical protein